MVTLELWVLSSITSLSKPETLSKPEASLFGPACGYRHEAAPAMPF
jgi:hypothetical protein